MGRHVHILTTGTVLQSRTEEAKSRPSSDLTILEFDRLLYLFT